MSTVQLPGSNIFDSHMQMHTGNEKYDVILAKEFQHHLENNTAEMVSLIRENPKNDSQKENGQTYSIMFRIMLMLNSKM